MACPVWTTLENRYYIDAFYMRAIVYPVRDTWSAGVYWFNQNVLDAVVNGDPDVAESAMRAHLDSVIDALRQWEHLDRRYA